MLPQQNRLKKKRDFEKAFKKGKGFKEGFLFLKVASNGLKINRFGFVVGKIVSKKAVLRNKSKRRMREIIRQIKPLIKKEGKDIILVARPGIEKKEFKEIKETVVKIFEKAKIVKID